MGYSTNFIALPKEAFYDRRLNFRDLRVLLSLISFVNKKDQKNINAPSITVRREKIAERAEISVAAVTNHTARLQKFGYLSKSGNGGYSRPATYELLIPEIPNKSLNESLDTSPDSGYLDSGEGSHPFSGEGSHPESGEGKEQRFFTKENNQQSEVELTIEEEAKLMKAGLLFSSIKNLFAKYPKDAVFEKVELLKAEAQKGLVYNPSGWLAKALAHNFEANPTAPQAERQASHVPFPSQASSMPSTSPDTPASTQVEFIAPSTEQVEAWLSVAHPATQKDFAELGFDSARLRGTYRAWANQKNH